MPSIILGNRMGNPFDLVGERQNRAIRHVGLLASEAELLPGSRQRVFHMGPPLGVGGNDAMTVHVAGWHVLSKDERDGLEEWLADIRTLAAKCHYIAYPAVQKIKDRTSGRMTGWKFSCAGFVKQAYQDGAEIMLVKDEADLPPLDYERLAQIWGDHPRLFRRWGLDGQGPWQVLVPGYMVHAMNQPRVNLPFRPSLEHIDFM